jgi:predicted phage terminase large subunit-like protein
MKIGDIAGSSPVTLGQALNKGLEFNPCQKYICRRVVDGIIRGNARFVVSVPPQHGKSTICSLWLPVWFLNKFPQKNVIVTSYNYQNAVKWGKRIRNVIIQNPHILKVKVAHDSGAAGFWETSSGGGVLCAGSGGTTTGNPGHLIIVDDPFKNWQEAQSENVRQKIIDWYKTVLTTRFQSDTTVLVVATRWHENDLSGYLLSGESGEKWEEVRIPAIAEENDMLGRAQGEALWSEKFDIAKLEQRKKDIGNMMFAALYQQSPQAQKGNVFLREYFNRISRDDIPTRFDQIVHSWDTALETKKANSYTAMTRWGIKEAQAPNSCRFYLLGTWRAKADYPSVRAKMLELYFQDGANTILLEDKASGKPLRQELSLNTALPIMPVEPCADKLARAWSVIVHFISGRVWIVSGEEWADELIAGLAAFPNGNYTDVADSVSQALAWMGGIKRASIDMLKTQLEYMEQTHSSRFTRHILPHKDVFRFGGGDYYD